MVPKLIKKNIESLNTALKSFSTEGLRTLVMAEKVIQAREFHDWLVKWKKVMLSNDPNKENLLDKLAEEIENNLELIGCSGIEDKLQDNVPNTIQTLMNTNIRLWVLTGDKEETAIEIAKSCYLIRPDMNLILLSSNSLETIQKKLQEQSQNHFLNNTSFEELEYYKKRITCELSIVVDGLTLT